MSELRSFSESPFNAAPDPGSLCDTFLTPDARFFVRNHGPVPTLAADSFLLVIDGLVRTPLQLSLASLRADYVAHEVVAALQCAGNRRTELLQLGEIPDELPWDQSAIGNAAWRGVRLRDLLQAAGLLPEAEHIAFLGCDEVLKDGINVGFGGSIPVSKALEADTLLACEMNGAPLSPDRGYPLRVIVPGYYGARSVKWVTHIRAQHGPSENYFQTRAGRHFSPDATPENADWENAPMLGEMPLTAAICTPLDGSHLASGPLRLSGYALSASGPIERVEFSLDDGQSWQVAELIADSSRWSWVLWQAEIALSSGNYAVLVRAWDCSEKPQPKHLEEVWNFKGYANHAWHRIHITVT